MLAEGHNLTKPKKKEKTNNISSTNSRDAIPKAQSVSDLVLGCAQLGAQLCIEILSMKYKSRIVFPKQNTCSGFM